MPVFFPCSRSGGVAPMRAPSERDALVVTCLVFLAPVLVFALRLPAPAAICVAPGVAGAGWIVSRMQASALDAPLQGRMFLLCLGAATVLCALGGEGHLFYSASDWLLRDAVLADAIRGPFPLFYRSGAVDYFLRAPLGMYMLPALVGRAFGIMAAHYAVLAQNALLYAAILYFAARLTGAGRLRFLAVLLLFSGVDIVPRLAVDVWRAHNGAEFEINPLIMFWNDFFKYFGHIPSLFWAPNHALPAWFAALLALMCWRRDIDLASLAVLAAGLLFWSPLAILGALPLLALCGARTVFERSIARREGFAVVVIAGLAPLIVYLTADSGAVPRQWLIGKDGFWSHYAALLAFSIPQVWLLLARWRDVAPELRAPLAAAIVFVVLAPFYKLGDDNDLAMRGAIAPLFVVAIAFASAAPALLAGGRILHRVVLLVIGLSAVTGLFELRRAIMDPAYRPGDCNILTAYAKFAEGLFPSNYLARLSQAPSWLVRDDGAPRLQAEKRVCVPDYSLVPEQFR